MNSKTLVIVTSVLILSLLTNFYLLTTKNGTKQSANLSPTFSSTSNTSSVNFPIDVNKKGISSAVLFYIFSGKITKVEPVGQYTRLTLDISDKQTPEFLVKLDSIFDNRGTTPAKIPASSLKLGQEVIISMTYDIGRKIWDVSNVAISPSSK